MAKIIYDYYTIAVPGDCVSTMSELHSIAIDQARELTRLYCIPAEWTSTLISGEIGDYEVTFRVRRRRHKS